MGECLQGLMGAGKYLLGSLSIASARDYIVSIYENGSLLKRANREENWY